MKILLVAAGMTALLIAGCDDADRQAATPPADQTTEAPGSETAETPAEAGDSDAGQRAMEALGEAGAAAKEAAIKAGEAGNAAFEALQENAPAIRERAEEAVGVAKDLATQAGEQLQGAADTLLNDQSDAPPLDAEGDSERDLNETPETREPAAPQ